MERILQKYIEPLSDGELNYLIKTEAADRVRFFRVYLFLMGLAVMVSFGGVFFYVDDTVHNGFTTLHFLFSTGVLLAIINISTWLTWIIFHRNIQLDIRYKTKTTERTQVNKKLCIEKTRACYCYIDSKIKHCIEVNYFDYLRLNAGDEICIEYATRSKMYLGYY